MNKSQKDAMVNLALCSLAYFASRALKARMATTETAAPAALRPTESPVADNRVNPNMLAQILSQHMRNMTNISTRPW